MSKKKVRNLATAGLPVQMVPRTLMMGGVWFYVCVSVCLCGFTAMCRRRVKGERDIKKKKNIPKKKATGWARRQRTMCDSVDTPIFLGALLIFPFFCERARHQ